MESFPWSRNNKLCDVTSEEMDAEKGEKSKLLSSRLDGKHADYSGEEIREEAGLTTMTSTLFIIGEMAGVGILAMPYVLSGTGYIGLVLIGLIGVLSAYTGVLIARCWDIVQEDYPEYRGHSRSPYPTIAEVTFGKAGRIILSMSLQFSLFGGCIVILIMITENTRSLIIHHANFDISFCILVVVFAVVLCPFTWFGRPKDFWPIACVAAGSNSIAIMLIPIAILLDYMQHDGKPITEHPKSTQEFFPALGIVFLAFHVHTVLPTFQMDMKIPSQFRTSIYIAFSATTVMYLAVAACGYLVYGQYVTDNILLTISPGPMLDVINALMTIQGVCAFIITMNPISQSVEGALNVSKEFNVWRVVVRSFLVGFVLFVVETVPRFGPILSLIGGTDLVTFICPTIFYYKLCYYPGGQRPVRFIPLHVKALLLEVLVSACVIEAMASFKSIKDLTSPDALTMPCYLK